MQRIIFESGNYKLRVVACQSKTVPGDASGTPNDRVILHALIKSTSMQQKRLFFCAEDAQALELDILYEFVL